MTLKSPEPSLRDIVDAIDHIHSKMKDVSFSAFESDWEKRWLIERGAEIISEASRRLPDDLKGRHPQIPWKQIAGIGNILRHSYDSVSPRVLWNISRNDLTLLEEVCKTELRNLASAKK